MADSGRTPLLLGGAAIVVLSGVAAYVGATLAHRDTPAPPQPAAAPMADATAEAIERRIGYLEERLQAVEETAKAALDRAAIAEGRLDALAAARAEAGNAKPGGAADGRAAPGSADDRPDQPADETDRMQRLYVERVARPKLVNDMKLLADATAEGAAARRTQAFAETRALISRFGLRGEDVEETLRRILVDQFEAGAREVGPLVRDGLERADTSAVKSRLHAILAETDGKIRPLLDDEKWKEYQEAAAGSRKLTDTLLDEFEAARLSTRPPGERK